MSYIQNFLFLLIILKKIQLYLYNNKIHIIAELSFFNLTTLTRVRLQCAFLTEFHAESSLYCSLNHYALQR